MNLKTELLFLAIIFPFLLAVEKKKFKNKSHKNFLTLPNFNEVTPMNAIQQ